jgi:penicillin-binding protein 2
VLIFDQLKKNDSQLRIIAVLLLCGLAVLVAGLWWVQIVSSRDYQANLEMQSFRTVRIPAPRGKIFDRNGIVLAENRPSYNVSLYLDELRKEFDAASSAERARFRAELKQQREAMEKQLGRSLNKVEKKKFILTLAQRAELEKKARFEVASNVVARITHQLHLAQPLFLNPTNFERHYLQSRALPFPVVTNLTPAQIGLFEEQSTSAMGVDVETESIRYYPFSNTAAHVVGYVRRDNSSMEGEESFFSYRLPDYRGQVGIEGGYDKQLRGIAGSKSVQVNSAGYRQMETIWSPVELGSNLVLTIDIKLQEATESALLKGSPTPMAAAVVMDVHTGDILALASIPTYNPNSFIHGFTASEYARLIDTNLNVQINRATQGQYAPGSIFKTIVGLAALESGWDPNAIVKATPNPTRPDKAIIYVGHQPFHDTAPPGDYNFRRALKLSSNFYFITAGLRTGIERIVRLGQRLHLGESANLSTKQDIAGSFPSLHRINSGWMDGNTANVSIGQDPILVNPLQMAVLASALANGGKVLWPRLVQTIVPQDPAHETSFTNIPPGQFRDELGVSPRNLAILKEAMLADVEDSDGTGRQAAVAGIRICGKTGTAQVKDLRGNTKSHNVWFLSFAPYERPRYAVVVMVEGGSSGGGDCAPIAHNIYEAILEREQAAARPVASANNPNQPLPTRQEVSR